MGNIKDLRARLCLGLGGVDVVDIEEEQEGDLDY